MLKEKNRGYLLNDEIEKLLITKDEKKNEEILLINESGGKEKITLKEAMNKAQELELDLCCVSPNPMLPVCKIINYGKHLFELEKKNKKKTKKITKKVIKLHLNTNERDLYTKINQMKKWIKTGESVIKVMLFMLRRENEYPEISHKKCEEISEKIKEEINNIEIKDNKIIREKKCFYFFVQKRNRSINEY